MVIYSKSSFTFMNRTDKVEKSNKRLIKSKKITAHSNFTRKEEKNRVKVGDKLPLSERMRNRDKERSAKKQLNTHTHTYTWLTTNQ